MKDPTTPSLPLRLGAPLLFALLALPLSAADREFTLEARMTGYVGSGGPIAGERNPTLRVTKGARKSVDMHSSFYEALSQRRLCPTPPQSVIDR